MNSEELIPYVSIHDEITISLSPRAMAELYGSIEMVAEMCECPIAQAELENFRNVVRSQLQRYGVYIDGQDS